MAVVQGIKEKVHLPIYDCLRVKPEEQLGKEERSNTWKFFVDVQGKTKLETNLQAASLLPHYNTFEARAMRVVISDLPPKFPDEGEPIELEEMEVYNDADPPVLQNETATVTLTIARAMELLQEARESDEGEAEIDADDEDVELSAANANAATVTLPLKDLEAALEESKEGPPLEQIRPNDGAGTLVGKVVYNTVTSLYVGEKVMIEMPTWFFPGGAGPYSETGKFTTHGEPSPISTFKFAEPIYIDKNQNFRVEMEIPDSDVLKEIQRIYGPLFIWIVLDGFMTRDVQ